MAKKSKKRRHIFFFFSARLIDSFSCVCSFQSFFINFHCKNTYEENMYIICSHHFHCKIHMKKIMRANYSLTPLLGFIHSCGVCVHYFLSPSSWRPGGQKAAGRPDKRCAHPGPHSHPMSVWALRLHVYVCPCVPVCHLLLLTSVESPLAGTSSTFVHLPITDFHLCSKSVCVFSGIQT